MTSVIYIDLFFPFLGISPSMVEQDEKYETLFTTAIQLLDQGVRGEELENRLRQQSEDIVLITVVITEAKKNHFGRLRKQGNILIGIGLLFVLAGFLITCLNFHSNRSFDYAMYGFTTIGIGLVFFGLYRIIG